MTLQSPEATIAGVRSRMGDTATKAMMTDADLDACIQEAVGTDYSRARPRLLVADVPGDGQELPLSDLDGWVAGLSRVSQVEYPATDPGAGVITEALVMGRDYQAPYKTPDGDVILFLVASPSSTEMVRVSYMAPHVHTFEEDTVPAGDTTAVLALSTSIACLRMATRLAAAEDQTIMADGVNRGGASARYQSMAKVWRERYLEHLGQTQSATQLPVLVMHEWDTRPATGGRRWLTH